MEKRKEEIIHDANSICFAGAVVDDDYDDDDHGGVHCTHANNMIFPMGL